MTNSEITSELRNIMASTMNGETYGDTQHPINFYPRGDFFMTDIDAAWDILNQQWVKKPSLTPQDFDPETVFADVWATAQSISEQWDITTGKLKRDMRDYDVLVEAAKHPEVKTKLRKRIEDKIQDIESSIGLLVDEYKIVHGERMAMYSRKPEDLREAWMASSNWTTPNVLYKILEKYGYLQTLSALSLIWDSEHTDFKTDDGIEQAKEILQLSCSK